MFLKTVKIVVWILILAACSGQNTPQTRTTIPTTPTLTPTPIAQPSAIPTTEATPANERNLVIWWPDALSPNDRAEVTELLNQQIRDFSVSENDQVNLTFRLKRYSDVGGIISTLRAANGVAPGALPDLTLIRREDLLSAIQSGLVYPLEGLVSFGVINGIYDSALELGQYQDQLYALPYMQEIQIVAYHDTETIAGWTFDDVLTREQVIVFPARRVNGVNRLFFAQYLAAGGTLPLSDGSIEINRQALLDVLSYYEAAYQQGLIPDDMPNYTTVSDYLPAFILEELDTAVISTTTYFDLRSSGESVMVAPLPTRDGDPIGLLNGWLWVITTSNTEQQELAASFINWMMDIQRQTDFASAVHMLPSQRSALQRLDRSVVDVSRLDSISEGAFPPYGDLLNGSVARVLQNGFISVINGESSAEDAVQDIIDQLNTE